jgi:hypothetical protein
MGSLNTTPRWSRIFWNSEAASLPLCAARYARPRTYAGYSEKLSSLSRSSKEIAGCRISMAFEGFLRLTFRTGSLSAMMPWALA